MKFAGASFPRPVTFGVLLATGTLLALCSTLVPAGAQVPGPNVNMISVDKHLQKQNEIDLTISPRNPCHIVGAANDYRTVDNKGLNADGEIGDSWIGVYVSTDCGETWLNYIMPGYRVSYTAAADPMARFGPGGGLYISHMQFNRGSNAGKIAVARYFDFNNVEGVPAPAAPADDQSDLTASPIGYLGTLDVATGSSGRFLDKPSMAVAPGQGVACSVNGVTIPATNVYVAWSEFTGNGNNPQRSKVYFARSTDCGKTLAGPATKLSEGDPLNQGTVIAVHPTNPNIIYVAWRQVGTAKNKVPDAILFAKSTDGGRKFSKSEPVTYLDGAAMPGLNVRFLPFDQETTSSTFRTLGYPAMVVDETGRVYLAVSARVADMRDGTVPSDDPQGGSPVNLPTSRILVTSTVDGLRWEPPIEVDNPAPGSQVDGHQFMPAMAYAGGRLNLTWYDLRYDESEVFKAFADEKDVITSGTRHTLDVRGAQAQAGTWPPSFSVYGVSELGDAKQKVSLYHAQKLPPPAQLNFNRPNLKLYAGGTKPFIGDYIGTAGVQYVLGANGQWLFNGRHVDPTNTVLRTFQTAWTDNRDAIVGKAGDPAVKNPDLDYVKPGTAGAGVCSPESPELAKMNSRNANVYTSRISPGLYLAALGNTKPTDVIERAYAIQVENGTGADMTVRLRFVAPAGVRASFTQPAVSGANVGERVVTVGKYSSTARTIYVAPTSSSLRYPRIDVFAEQLIGPPVSGEPPVTPMRAAIVLNADPTNPLIRQPVNTPVPIVGTAPKDTHTPRVENPRVENPRVENPRVENPRVENPRVENPRVENPRVENTVVEAPRVENPRVENPRVENPRVENASFSDITYEITNDGNTTSAFELDFRTSTPTSGYAIQLMAWRGYLQPMVGEDCQLKYTEVPQVFYNEMLAPDVDLFNGIPAEQRPSVVIRPGESIRWTLRMFDTHSPAGTFEPFCTEPGPVPSLTDCASQATAVVTAQAVSTGQSASEVSTFPAGREGTEAFRIEAPVLPLPSAVAGTLYSQTFSVVGGTAPYAWSTIGTLPGLSISNTGVLSGTPTGPGKFAFAVRVADAAGHSDTQTFSMTIAPGMLVISTPSTLPEAVVGFAYNQALAATGGTNPYAWTVTGGALPPGLSLSGGAITGVPTARTPSTVTVQLSDSGSPQQTATATLTIPMPAAFRTYVVTTTDDSGPGSLRQAIINANANTAATDLIAFDIPGTAPFTIRPLSALPTITEAVLIDGLSQPGTLPPGTMPVELTGVAAGSGVSGLTISGGTGSSIRGLVINGFSRWGIYLDGAANGNSLAGNYIGTNVSGTAAIPNTNDGILVLSSGNSIGGTGAGAGNVVSGNGWAGISIADTATGNLVRGNSVGVAQNGVTPVPNTGGGVVVRGTGNTIGGLASVEGNLVASNTAGQILVGAGTGHMILSNRVIPPAGSGQVGIDLGPPGVNPNDPGDGDTGANGLQNYPEMAWADNAPTPGQTTVHVTFNSTANTAFTLQFFRNSTCAPPTRPAENVVATIPVSTGGDGNVTQTTFTLPLIGVGSAVTATATGLEGTSEVSACVPVINGTPLNFAVLNRNDSGPGSLRQTILDANSHPGADTITFDITGSGPLTISPTSALPSITAPVTINATTQPGYAGTPIVELSGAAAGSDANGLYITGGGSTVRGLVINGFSNNGIAIGGGGGNVIAGNYVGLDVTGTLARPNVLGGIALSASTGNTVGGLVPADRNVISGNGNVGVGLYLGGDGNFVRGNFVGTNAAGTAAIPNAAIGILLEGGNNNVIGGTGAGARNVLSGNGNFGISAGLGSSGTAVEGNYIGTNAAGNAALPNASRGISISNAGSTSIRQNVIAGHSPGTGIWIGSGTTGTTIRGNFVGTNAAGNAALPNEYGVDIAPGAGGPEIGGLAPEDRNVISGNTNYGIGVNPGVSGTLVRGNYIGTNPAGTMPIGNGRGIVVAGGDSTIGGLVPEARNIVSGNTGIGIELAGPGATGNTVQGNYVGVDATGAAALANGSDGIYIGPTVTGNTIGAGNVVSGNARTGITVFSTGTTIVGNRVGTNALGTSGLPNLASGVSVWSGDNQIVQNLLSGNAVAGVTLRDAAARNVVRGNKIGTDVGGTVPIGNEYAGVWITYGAQSNTVGGTTTAEQNVISGNNRDGVLLSSSTTTGNVVQGNLIGTTASGLSALPNSNGVRFDLASGESASGNTIGGFAAGAGNVIAYNTGTGIVAEGGTNNQFLSNSIRDNGRGIDLYPVGSNANDLDDPDNGPNGLQNYPEILSVDSTTHPGFTYIQLRLNSKINLPDWTYFTLQFFANTNCATPAPQAERFFFGFGTGTLNDTTIQLLVSYPEALPVGAGVTVTATGLEGTSEISACYTIQAAANPSGIGLTAPALWTRGAVSHLIMNVTPGQNPTSTGLRVEVDARQIGLSPTLQLNDAGVGCDDISGDNTFIGCATAIPSTPYGVYVLPVTISDDQGRTTSSSITVTLPAGPSGTITGTLIDGSGGVLPGVTVAIRDTATGAVHSVVTDPSGVFIFLGLPPDVYAKTSPVPRTGIVLHPGETLNLGPIR